MFFKVFQNVSEDFLLNMNSTTEVKSQSVKRQAFVLLISLISKQINKNKQKS